jgi:hypothetical protein
MGTETIQLQVNQLKFEIFLQAIYLALFSLGLAMTLFKPLPIGWQFKTRSLISIKIN